MAAFVARCAGVLTPLFLLLLAAPNPAHAQSPAASPVPVLYCQGDPSDDEQYLLQKLNRARQDPAGEGQRLAAWLRNTPVGQEVIAQYGIDPNRVAADFAALPAVPPLAFNADLGTAARSHSTDIAAHGGSGPNNDIHAGYDGSTPLGRVDASGYKGVFSAECATPALPSLDAIHAGYLVDWGVPDLGHRQEEMDGASALNVVGIGVARASTNFVETEEFGRLTSGNASALLTGVVFHDADGDGEYSTGEGIAGVAVSMDGGTYYAVTTASGGYALPLVNPDGSNATGTVAVRLTFPDGGGTLATVTISRYQGTDSAYLANVEWDATDAADQPLPVNPALPRLKAKPTSVAAGGVATFKVFRPADSDPAQPYTVRYKAKGSAVAGVDYQPLPGALTVPAGVAAARVPVMALGPRAGTATLVLKLKGVPGKPGKATVTFTP